MALLIEQLREVTGSNEPWDTAARRNIVYIAIYRNIA